MIVDPAVSRRKFATEVQVARAQSHWQRQGIWILRTEYPIVFVVLATPMSLPIFPGVISAVHFDFTDYDVRPPSVKFVDPFTEEPLAIAALKWHFQKASNVVRQPTSDKVSAELVPYVQSFDQIKPFLCTPGVREYHDCSGHSGDSWFLHRRQKGNVLVHLLTMLQRYGAGAIQGISYQVATQLRTRLVE